jgi:hypothetical protein
MSKGDFRVAFEMHKKQVHLRPHRNIEPYCGRFLPGIRAAQVRQKNARSSSRKQYKSTGVVKKENNKTENVRII